MTNQDVTELFYRWSNALSEGNAKNVAELYAANAILLPTISNQVRHNTAEIEEYFVQLLEVKASADLIEQNIRIFEQLAFNSGVYQFNFQDGTKVKARYSFVYQLIDNDWKIIEHHSSRMPE
jgi:uncharacterized protein (TIGR02246 family)